MILLVGILYIGIYSDLQINDQPKEGFFRLFILLTNLNLNNFRNTLMLCQDEQTFVPIDVFVVFFFK